MKRLLLLCALVLLSMGAAVQPQVIFIKKDATPPPTGCAEADFCQEFDKDPGPGCLLNVGDPAVGTLRDNTAGTPTVCDGSGLVLGPNSQHLYHDNIPITVAEDDPYWVDMVLDPTGTTNTANRYIWAPNPAGIEDSVNQEMSIIHDIGDGRIGFRCGGTAASWTTGLNTTDPITIRYQSWDSVDTLSGQDCEYEVCQNGALQAGTRPGLSSTPPGEAESFFVGVNGGSINGGTRITSVRYHVTDPGDLPCP